MNAVVAGIQRWLIVLLLSSAMLFSLVDRFGLSLMIDPIKRALHINDGQIGLLNGVAFGLFYAAMGLPFGWLVDRWSRTRTVALGVGIWSIATAACGLAATFPQLLLARVGVGAGEASLAPAGYGLIYDRFPLKSLARAISTFQVGAMIGSGLAFVIAGGVYEFFLKGGWSPAVMANMAPWQKTFVVLGCPGPIYVAIFCFIRERRAVASPAPKSRISAEDKAVILRNVPVYSLLFLGMAGNIITTFGLLSWFPAILSREYHWAPAKVGSIYGAVVMISGSLGLILGGTLTDFLSTRGDAKAHSRVALLSVSIALPLALAFLVAGGATMLLVVVTCLHFVLCLANGSTPAFIQLVTPRLARGQMSALYILIVNVLGLGLGPTLIGFLSARAPVDPHALRVAVCCVILPSLAGAISMLWLLVRDDRSAYAMTPGPEPLNS